VTAGAAGLVAGALSMAAGEYVSVSSQRDTELADLRLEKRELERDPEGELKELAAIYESRGLPGPLARQVAMELSKGDRLATHARDELGFETGRQARPLQAAWASALSFTAGAAVPLLAIALAPTGSRAAICVVVALVGLGILGSLGAALGGAPRMRAAARVLVWGTIAMAVTSGIGALAGGVV
jgi:vacuolar iron transporter family protein